MSKHIESRATGLPEDLRKALIEARHQKGWTQAKLGKMLGLPQMHISGIERGRVTPRYDTLLDLVRLLEHDLVLIPRQLVPVVDALVKEHRAEQQGLPYDEERPLYTLDEEDTE